MKRRYRQIVGNIPWLNRQRRRYRHFDRFFALALISFACGFLMGIAATLETQHDPVKALGVKEKRPGIGDWFRSTFAPIVTVPGHQLDGSFVFADFESVGDFSLWKTEAAYLQVAQENFSEGSHSVKISYHNNTRLSSVTMESYFNSRYALSDWSGYRALAFYLFNPQDTRERIIIQIKDRRGKRFKEDLVMDPERGTNFVLDLDRIRKEIDIHRIEHINFFVWDSKEEKEFFLDHLRLLPANDGGKQV